MEPAEQDEPTFSASLGLRLRELRIQAGLSQEKLARRLEMSRETVRRIEAGEGTTTHTVDLILATLGASGPDLLPPPEATTRVWRHPVPSLLAA